MKPYNRRDLFKTFGSSALFLHPILSAREGYGAEVVKKRFFCMLTSSGVIQASFWPKGNEGSYDFAGTALEPLTSFKSDLTIARGFKNDYGPYDSHSSGAVSLLTGDYLNDSTCKGTSCDYIPGTDIYARGISIDQMIAESVKGKTAQSSLVLGIQPTQERPSRYLSYDATGKVVKMATNPYTVFDTIFKDLLQNCGSAPVDAAALAKAKGKRKSVLDAIKADLADAVRLSGLNTAEKAKLDAYSESIRAIEASMDAVASTAVDSCTNLKSFISGAKVEVNNDNYVQLAKLMMDLIISAFQLDVTRVATLVWSVGGVDGVQAKWANYNGSPISQSYHHITHYENSDTSRDPQCAILDKWQAGQFAYFIGQLKASKEGNSNILDNSLALWTSEIGEGSSHTPNNIPFILAGKAAGAMKTGRYKILPEKTAHQTGLLSILEAMDIKGKTSIGRSGPISPILLG